MATENKIVWLNLTFFGRVKEILILTEIYCVSDILCNGTITKTFNARKAKNTQICSLLLSESQFQLYNLAKCLPSMYKAPSLVPSTSKNKNNPNFPDPVGLPSHLWSSGQNVRMYGVQAGIPTRECPSLESVPLQKSPAQESTQTHISLQKRLFVRTVPSA